MNCIIHFNSFAFAIWNGVLRLIGFPLCPCLYVNVTAVHHVRSIILFTYFLFSHVTNCIFRKTSDFGSMDVPECHFVCRRRSIFLINHCWLKSFSLFCEPNTHTFLIAFCTLRYLFSTKS